MVHALYEVWRVLKKGGIVIDLRPISVGSPLLILTEAGWKSAGPIDQSPDRVHDVAANRAMRMVIQDRLFIKLQQKYFSVRYYWDDIKDFELEVEQRWKDEVIISEQIWRQARRLFKKGNGEKRICVPFRTKLYSYQRN